MPTATRTVHRICSLCEACCGLTVTVADDRVVAVRGDADDPRSRGYLCPKGVANIDLLADPDRLRRPLLRGADGELRESTWDAALDAAADGLADVVRRHGPDAVALYVGNAAVHGAGALLMVNELQLALGTRSRYTASSLDQQPQQLANYLLFGSPVLFAVPDLDRTSFLLVVGGNPAVSNGSLMTAPDMRRRIREIRDRGGRVVVVDPRRTETARLADTHLAIRPGTDAFLLLGLLHVVATEGLVDLGPVAPHVSGVAALAAAAAAFPPERVAALTGVAPEAVRALAREFAAADGAAAYGRLGVCLTPFGTTASWLLTCLNVLTGNLDRPGGTMFPQGVVDLPEVLARFTGLVGYDRFRSRVGDIPEVMGDLPAATLAEEILTPGPGQVRALVTVGGNPVLSAPGGHRTDEALASLEMLVSIDPYVTETARHAHVVLPPVTSFERSELDVVFGALSVRNHARWSPRAVAPPPGTKDDAEILAGLVARLARRVGSPAARARALAVAGVVGRGGLDRILDLGIRTGPYGGVRPSLGALLRGGPLGGLTLGKVRAAPHGLDLGPLRPALPGRLRTPGRTVRLDHPVLVGDLDRLRRHAEQLEASSPDDTLLLIGRRHLRSNNSWLHNSPRLVRGRDRCTVLVHPDDAAARGLVDGAAAEVVGPSGTITLPVEVGDEIVRGAVAVPHGWGHGRPGVGWHHAAGSPGVSVNDVTDPAVLDPLSGTAALQAVPVVVRPAAG